MAKLIAIGGGFPYNLTNQTYDYICSSAKEHANKPKILVLPTPTEKSEYCDSCVQHVYESFGINGRGCDIEVLYLNNKPIPSQDEILEKILGANILYVTGGDPMDALDIWPKHGVDLAIKEFFKIPGKIYTGISAGTLLPFSLMLSDHPVMRDIEPKKSVVTPGLGIYSGNKFIVVHYDVTDWGMKRDTITETKRTGKSALCIDDCVGLEINEDRMIRFWSEKSGKKVYFSRNHDSEYVEIPLEENFSQTPKSAKFKPINEILN